MPPFCDDGHAKCGFIVLDLIIQSRFKGRTMNNLVETFGSEAIFIVFGVLALSVVFAMGALSGKDARRKRRQRKRRAQYEDERFNLLVELSKR